MTKEGAGIIACMAIHALLCLLCLFDTIRTNDAGRKAMLPGVLFVPFFGPASFLAVKILHRRGLDGCVPIAFDPYGVGESIYRSLPMENADAVREVVPLEEAILLDDNHTRRTLMLDILKHSPDEYIPLMQKAVRSGSDQEMTHYASTAIMEVQRQFVADLKAATEVCELHPKDEDAWRELCRLQESYLNSGLMDRDLANRHRLMLEEQLLHLATLAPTNLAVQLSLAENRVSLGRFEAAEAVLKKACVRYPKEEDVWLGLLSLYGAWGDADRLRLFLMRLQEAPVLWTAKGRERVSFWQGENDSKRGGECA